MLDKKLPALLFLTVLYFTCFGQSTIGQILEESRDLSYSEIIEKGDRYFSSKYPNLSPRDLVTGQHRDGDFVKYQRWQSFWQDRIEQDGTMADLGYYGQQYQDMAFSRSNDHFDNIEWKNISYLEDLGVQIGLGRTNCIAFHPTDPDIYYVGAGIGGVWRTEDGGQSYEALGDELPFLAVSSIIINRDNPQILYAAISDRVWYGPPSMGIFKSEDGGNTWSPTSVSLDFKSNTRIYWMEADPNQPEVIFYATSNGLYRTLDGFATSQFVASGRIVDVKFKPGSSEVIYYARTNANSFYRSTNGGDNFELVQNFGGSSYARIAVSPLDPEKVYVSVDNKLHKSFDAGASFTEEKSMANTETNDGVFMISPKDDKKLYTGFFEVYRSNNDGGLFIPITNWLGNFGLQLIHVDQRNAFINPLQSDYIYFCNDGGIHRLDVNTNQFTNLSNGLSITQFYDIAVSQSDLSVMSGGSQDNGNVFMDDYVWTYAAPTADGMMQDIDPTDATYRYNAIQNGRIYRFNGSQRTDISNNIPGDKGGKGEWITPFLLDPNDPKTVVAGYDAVYRSKDRGNTWTALGGKIAQGRNIDLLTIAPSNSERIYAVENWGVGTGNHYGGDFSIARIYAKSLDNDTDWSTNVILVDEPVRELRVHPKNENHVYVCVAGYTVGHKVFESKDAGATWSNISGNLPNAPVTAINIYEDSSTTYLIVGTDAGVFYSEEGSESWASMGDLPNTYITDIEIQKEAKVIRIGTHGRGIFEASLEENSSSIFNQDVTEDCFNIQPNPADSYINISGPSRSGSLEIYNYNGQLLMNSTSPSIDVGSLSDGLYIAKWRDEVSRKVGCVQKLVVSK